MEHEERKMNVKEVLELVCRPAKAVEELLHN